MYRIILPLLLSFFIQNTAIALSVVPDVSLFGCGNTSVTFTFDCGFTGSVFIANSLPTGVTLSNVPYSSPPFIDITSGTVSFDIDINLIGSAGSFDIDFFVISSNLSCAAINEVATAVINYNCIYPENNECNSALPVEVTSMSCTTLNFNTLNGTSSGNPPSCTSGTIATWGDLWYSFYATDTSIEIELNSGPGVLAYYAIYEGCPDNGGNELQCGQIVNITAPTNAIFTGLTTNEEYHLQILYNQGLNGQDMEFCLFSNAIDLPCPYETVVSNIGPNMPNNNYTASQIIESSGTTTVNAGGAIYDAGECVVLNQGFECTENFEAKIGGCTP